MPKSMFLKNIKNLVGGVLGDSSDINYENIKLTSAVRDGTVEEMQACIDNGAVVEETAATGRNALHEAVINEAKPEKIEFLLDTLKEQKNIKAINEKTYSGIASKFGTNSNGFTALGLAKMRLDSMDSGFKVSGSRENLLKTIDMLKEAGAQFSSADKKSLNMGKDIKQAQPSPHTKSPSIG